MQEADPKRCERHVGICEDLSRARAAADSGYFQVMDHYKGVRLLIVDDLMTMPLETQNAVTLFEITEASEGYRSTLIASQLESDEWYLCNKGELMTGSILNRIATTLGNVDLADPSMRRCLANHKGKGLRQGALTMVLAELAVAPCSSGSWNQ